LTQVTIKGLTKQFGKLTAVDNLDLDVKDKEFVSLLGPSGCGKTTTLNCLSGLETPTKGDIFFDDKRINDIPSKDRGIGLVFQSYAIFTHMSTFDNLAFGLKIRGASETELKTEVERMAEFLDIKEVLNQKAGKLSLTNMQKTAIGRTLLIKPKVLLLDEPLSNLDAESRNVMRTELKRLQKEVEQTTIFVTHDQLEAMTLSDRIAVMTTGRLQQYDTPANVYDHPKNQFVANFIGSPSMNFMDCSLKLGDERAYLVNERFTLDFTNHKDILTESANSPELVLGIRPEHVSVARPSDISPSAKGLHIGGKVFITELIGFESIVSVQVDDLMIKAIVPTATNFEINERIMITFDEGHLHVFSKNGEGPAIV
jgi:ABC-type sugar transport system ATPase subunit